MRIQALKKVRSGETDATSLCHSTVLTAVQTGMVAVSVLGGAATQRITGLGFALVASPLLVLVIGPFQGVLLANAVTLVINVIVLSSTWRAVELRRVILLIVPALIAVHFGARVSHLVPPAVLMIGTGSAVFLALVAWALIKKLQLFPGTVGALAAGGLSGFMNVTAGVGGPAITLYAVGAAWDQRGFVASMQVYFGVINIASILAKGLPSIGLATLAAISASLAMGIFIGQQLGRVVSPARARQAVIGLALIGSAATVAKGIFLL